MSDFLLKMTPEAREAYQRALKHTQGHHLVAKGKTFSGRFTWKQRHRIKRLVDRFDAKSMLDYGCGYGKQYQERDEQGRSLVEYWGIEPGKYDPGVAHYQTEPAGKYDLIICVQALGSIPTVALPVIIDRLYSFAIKAIFVAERIGAPHKKIHETMKAEMPHGRSAEWWLEMLARPGSPVKMVAAFHNPDETAGWPGWRIEEPEGQG